MAAELPINKSIPPGSEAFSDIFREWETLETQLLKTKRFPQAISGALSEPLMGDDHHDQGWDKRPLFGSYAEEFVGYYSQYGSGVLAEADAS